tara:strand:- start:24755 stop:25105 length:351 start_codon:yes stop_codon:yes gene_type:complete
MAEKNKDWKYLKIVSISMFLILFLIMSVDFTINYEKEKVEKWLQENKEVFELLAHKCELSYGVISYKGECNDYIIEGIANLVIIDKKIEIIQICMSNVNSYKYEICKEVGIDGLYN